MHDADLKIPLAIVETAISHVWARREEIARSFGQGANSDAAVDAVIATIGAVIGDISQRLTGVEGFDARAFDSRCTQKVD